MELNLKWDGRQERIVKEYLQDNASEELAKKINSGNKTLSGFFKYASSLAKKSAENGVACIEDKVVFGWAIHYFEEDSIKEGSVSKSSAPKKTTTAPAPAKKPEPKTGTQQMSLFDL